MKSPLDSSFNLKIIPEAKSLNNRMVEAVPKTVMIFNAIQFCSCAPSDRHIIVVEKSIICRQMNIDFIGFSCNIVRVSVNLCCMGLLP